jgi:hypothetical protein
MNYRTSFREHALVTDVLAGPFFPVSTRLTEATSGPLPCLALANVRLLAANRMLSNWM